MRNLRNLTSALLLMVCSLVSADDYAYLSIVQTDNQTDFAISSIQKITFSDGFMVFHLTDNTEQKLPVSTLSSMFFSADGTNGITEAKKQAPSLQLQKGVLNVQSQDGRMVTIYDMNGHIVHSSSSDKNENKIDLNEMPKGTYIVRFGSESKKIVNNK